MSVDSEKFVLELLIQTDPEGIVALESEFGAVKMIPFSGTVKGPLFHGITILNQTKQAAFVAVCFFTQNPVLMEGSDDPRCLRHSVHDRF